MIGVNRKKHPEATNFFLIVKTLMLKLNSVIVPFFCFSGLWSHKWHFEAPTSHWDLALFDSGVRPQKERNPQIPDHPFV